MHCQHGAYPERSDIETEAKRIRIGDWILDPELNQIEGSDGTVTLEPLAAEVLAYFARNHGKVIGPDELIENLWSRSYVGDSPVYRIMAELRRLLGDDARNPSYFETIRKRGYRLVAPVEFLSERGLAGETRSHVQSSDATPDAEFATKPAPAKLPGFAWIGMMFVVVAVAGYWLLSRPTTESMSAPNQPPVVAVLPFEDVSSSEASHIVRGLTDAVATRLSGVSQLRIISRNSTRQFDKSDESAQAIGKELGAQYLITGTVMRRMGDDDTEWLRVNAHLVDVATEINVWSQTYEHPLADIFELQSSIAERVAQQLDVTLMDAAQGEMQKSSDALTISAYARYLKGREALGRGFAQPDLQEAVSEFEAAIVEDPEFAQAYASLGLAHLQLYAQYWDRSEERLSLARTNIDRSLELDPTLVDAQFGLGSYYLRREMLAPALEHLEFVRLNRPSHTEALTAIGQVYQRQGKLDKAVEALDAAARFDPLNHLLLYVLGQTQIVYGDYNNAEESLERAITLRPELVEGYLFKAVLYMSWLGDERRAGAEFERAAAKIGMDNLMEWLLQPGLSSSFRFAGPVFMEALEKWQLEGSDADPAAYYLAMADHAEISGNKNRARLNYEKALVILEETVLQVPHEPFFLALLGSAYAGAGRPDEAIATGQRLLQMAPVERNPWDNADYLWYMAEIYVLAGLHDEAIAQVEIALQYPSTVTRAWIQVEPFWEPLRDDPRFQELVSDP